MTDKKEQNNITSRPPVVVIMGHIDHGKSTLLDYIRKSNIVEKEAGGITQHISAYEVIHKNEKRENKKITFIDTPGHEAFSKMRERGAQIADIAILIVSAEDSVKAQTIEAIQTIKSNKVPFVVAINKIDKPGANVEKTKIDLAENEVYLEGFGGDTPFAQISAKTGQGIDDLLSLILLVAELNDFKGNSKAPATGFILESHLDTKRGISATLIIKDGVIKSGMSAVAGGAFSGTRIFEDFLGKPIKEATFSSPIRLTGWSTMPAVGEIFETVEKKNEAEERALDNSKTHEKQNESQLNDGSIKLVPIIIKADVMGSTEAIEKELEKLKGENVAFKIIQKGVGIINEGDIRLAGNDKDAIIVGFNVKVDKSATDLNEQTGLDIKTFDTIYKLIEWLAEEIEKRRPRIETLEILGKAKIQKLFSKIKDKQVMGGKVFEGKLVSHNKVRIIRRENEIGTGFVVELQHNKQKTKEVESGNEFGVLIESKTEIAPGDVVESFAMVTK